MVFPQGQYVFLGAQGENMEENQPNEGQNPGYEIHPTGDWRVLGMLLVAVLIGLLIGNLLSVLLFQQLGLNPGTLLSLGEELSRPARDSLRLATLVTHLCTFSLPGLVLYYLLYKHRLSEQLRLDIRPSVPATGMSILFLLISFPLAQYIYWWNLRIPLPAELLKMEEDAGEMMRAFLVMDSPMEFLLNLLIVGLVAAFGEELIFRGIVQPRLQRITGSAVVSIWVTAFLFSAIHFQFAGFLPRMLLGGVLGYIYRWNYNLWVAVLAHFVFNGVQIAAQYFLSSEMDAFDPEKMSQPHWLTAVIPLFLLYFVGKWIKKSLYTTRTWHSTHSE